jgi:hypothetical protein
MSQIVRNSIERYVSTTFVECPGALVQRKEESMPRRCGITQERTLRPKPLKADPLERHAHKP